MRLGLVFLAAGLKSVRRRLDPHDITESSPNVSDESDE